MVTTPLKNPLKATKATKENKVKDILELGSSFYYKLLFASQIQSSLDIKGSEVTNW